MKKYLIVLLSFIFIPMVVFAEECEETKDPYCTGQSCLTNLQSKYNTWSSTGNTGKACINVIAVKKGNNKDYLEGKNPSTDYRCSDGSLAISKFVYSALADEDSAAECMNQTCYVPEVWFMDCGSSNTGSTNTGNTSNNGVVNNGSINSGNNSGNSNGDVSTNNNGQITGTTDTSETGVETYFIVLFGLTIISYLILTVSKKKNLFKNI